MARRKLMNNAKFCTTYNQKMRAITLALGMVFAAPAAHAASVDFRDLSFASAKGQTSYQFSVGGIQVTLSTNLQDAVLWWDKKDGFGVTSPSSYEEDEIEGMEKLLVSFSQPVTLAQFSVGDLFYENGYYEMGFYDVGDQGSKQGFLATKGAKNGERSVDVNQELSLISFSSLGRIEWQHHEFSLMGLDIGETIPAVPVPAAAWLFASGLAGLISFSRKHKTTATR
jgi:hypothetical protein